MLRRFLEKIEQEVRIVLSEEESQSRMSNISESAKRELERAESRIRDALKHMQRAVADAGEGSGEPPWA
jgi:exonuclease VII small subunit